MKNKRILFGGIALILVFGVTLVALVSVTVLGLASPFIITRSDGHPPTPIVESVAVVGGYENVLIDHVEVEEGTGSPIPVHVLVSGMLPDTCAQVEYIEQKQDGSNFIITLSTIPSTAEGCIHDGIPFKTAISLNVADLPAGTYAVLVNGARATFKLGAESPGTEPRTADTPIIKDDIKVDSVNVEMGTGSPVPVKVIVSGNISTACAQLGEVRLHRDGATFFVRLVADLPAGTDCVKGSLPFRLEVPLNIVNLPEGMYEVNVNGMTAGFGWGTAAAVPDDAGASLNGCGMPVDVPVVDGKGSYQGISFTLDPSITSPLAAQECPASSNQGGSMGTETHPAYTVFTFPGYAYQPMQYPPELRVYEVSGDMSAYTYPLNMLGDLQSAIDQRSQPATWYNAAPLHARQDYLDFMNGAGVRGLVQYMQNRFFYTNNGLLYEFNGLTKDGRSFVSLRYPLSVPFLMKLDSPDPRTNSNPQAIAIPDWPESYEQQGKIIEAYNAEALSRLEQMKDNETLPSIAILDALVQSLQVSRP